MTVIGIAACTGLMITGFGLKEGIIGATERQFSKIYRYDMQTTLNKIISETEKNDIIINKAYQTNKFTCPTLVFQRMIGANNIFIGLAGNETALVTFAASYAKEQFPELNEDAYHRIYDFITCNNRLYASKQNCLDIQIDIAPPEYCIDKTLTATTDMYIVPFLIHDEQANIIVCVNGQVTMN
jgi:hypothetical protein